MSNATATPAAPAKKGFGFFKAALGGGVGLATGVIGVYATAIVDKVAKPAKPLANFSVAHEGLTVTAQNRAAGQSGWWDFGDGSPLEPFDDDQPEVKHTYAKPGSYAVKLTVRNFLGEENDRSVPVDLAVPAAGTAGGPAVAGLVVEPVAGTTAPAMFRVRCELKNAQQTILDLGTGDTPELLTATGAFEKFVVYQRPGTYPLSLYAVGGGKLDKQWARVDVSAPAAGDLAVVAKVTDTGTRTERRTGPQQVVPVPIPPKPTGQFTKDIAADTGCTIAEVKLGTVKGPAKNVKVEKTADGKSAKLTGEWTGGNGGEVMVGVQLTQERAVLLPGGALAVSAHLTPASLFDASRSKDWSTGQKAATLQLPAAPAGGANVKRVIALELFESDAKGKANPVYAVADLTKPADEVAVTLSNQSKHVVRWEKLANGQLKVSVRPAGK